MQSIKVIFYKDDANGSVPVLEWLKGLEPKAQDECLVKIKRLAMLSFKLRWPETNWLGDKIYELQIGLQGFNYRIFYFFYESRVVVLVHGSNTDKVNNINEVIKCRKKFEQHPKSYSYIEVHSHHGKNGKTSDALKIIDRMLYKGKSERIVELEKAQVSDDVTWEIRELWERTGFFQRKFAQLLDMKEEEWICKELKDIVSLFIKLVLFSVFAFLNVKFLFPELLRQISSDLEALEMSVTGVSMKFRLKGKFKELETINVPANQLGVFSNVKLEKDKIIDIRATGLVTTEAGRILDETGTSNSNNQKICDRAEKFNSSNQKTSNQKTCDRVGNWTEAFKELKLASDFRTGWQDPNGDLIFVSPQHEKSREDKELEESKKSKVKCLDEVAKKRKLVEELPYGYLLGVIVDLGSLGSDEDEIEAAAYQLQRTKINSPTESSSNESLPFDLVNDKGEKVGRIKKIMAIGQKATIKFNNNKYEIKGGNLPLLASDNIDMIDSLRIFRTKSSEYYIYFIVNDTLLERERALINIENEFINNKFESGKKPQHCFKEIGLKYRSQGDNKLKVLNWKGEIWNYEKQLYPILVNPSSLWFLNNKGSFSVTIVRTKK